MWFTWKWCFQINRNHISIDRIAPWLLPCVWTPACGQVASVHLVFLCCVCITPVQLMYVYRNNALEKVELHKPPLGSKCPHPHTPLNHIKWCHRNNRLSPKVVLHPHNVHTHTHTHSITSIQSASVPSCGWAVVHAVYGLLSASYTISSLT